MIATATKKEISISDFDNYHVAETLTSNNDLVLKVMIHVATKKVTFLVQPKDFDKREEFEELSDAVDYYNTI